jgi:hypothetical protein
LRAPLARNHALESLQCGMTPESEDDILLGITSGELP